MATLKIKSHDTFSGDNSFYGLDDVLPLTYNQFVKLVRDHYVEVSSMIDGVYCPIIYSIIVLED